MIFKKIMSYLTFKKQVEQGQKASFNLRAMHGMNRISILMFFVAIIVMIIKIIKSF
jgi:hypothetical protein